LDFRRNMAPVWHLNGTYSTFAFVNETQAVLALAPPTQPLFLYVAFQAPQEYIDKFKNITDRTRRIHAAMTSVMDDAIGDIVKALKKGGYWENTVFVFSSDNGGCLSDMAVNWPFRGGKYTYFEGGTRVVGFVHSPLLPKAQGRVSKAMVHTVDWYPTFLRLATGAPPNPQTFGWLDGVNQWETITKLAKDGPRNEIIYNIDPLDVTNGYFAAALRVGDMKVITGNPCHKHKNTCGWLQNTGKYVKPPTMDFKVMLFNITADPYEKNDLVAKYPNVVKSLLARLAYYNSTMIAPINEPVDPKCDPGQFGGVWQPWMPN